MSQIIPFESGGIPAYLKAADVEQLNNDLLTHAGRGFPIISIKGKIFTVSRDGEKQTLMNPLDPSSPANRISMVIVKANAGTSKVYYQNGYVEGSDAKPDCFSNDGIRPDTSVEKPISKQCAACSKNQWGSKIGPDGRKGKACGDSVRIAVALPDNIEDPYFIRVPAASIRNLGELGKTLARKRVSYQMVVTEIGFDPTAATPLLTFKPVGFLEESQYKKVLEVAKGDVVQAILGSNAMVEETETPAAAAAPAPAPKPSPEPKVTTDEVKAAVHKAEAAPEPKPEPVAAGDIDLDDLSFD